MCFLIKDDEFCKKVRNSIKNQFDSEPVYKQKCLKINKKSYDGKINTNFHNNEIPKEGSQCIYLSVILIDSGFRTGKIVVSSDNSDRENSDRDTNRV